MLRWLVLGSFCAGVVACSSEPPAFGSGNGDSPDIGSDASVGGDGTNGAASGAPIGVTPAASAEEGGPNQANSAATNDVEENSGDESNGLNMTNANTDGSETDGPTTTAPDMMTSSSVNAESTLAMGCNANEVRACWELEDGTPLPGELMTSACAIGEQSCTAAGEWGPCEGAITPGAVRCDDLQPQVCDSTGSWTNDGSECPYLCNDETGACEGNCSPGAMQCVGLQPQLCDDEGKWEDSGSPCEFSCSATSGSCTGTCVAGSRRCNNSQPQECDADGAWQNSGAACGGCTTCENASGSCVADTGAQCDDGNACTTGETCQSNGMCGGGTPKTCGGADQCHTVGACVPASGCPLPVVAAGDACDDGNACTTGETCQSTGTCGGGSNVTCPGADECHTVGACVPTTGCPMPVVQTGSACDDGNACTTGETCQASGMCQGGNEVVCGEAADQCHTVGACLPASGCPAPVVKAGNCDDGNVCTVSDSCQTDGVCAGSMAPHTTSCGNNMYCDGMGACKCRTKSSWNLLTNPGFDGSTNSWTMSQTAYATVDADSCTGSGSVHIPAPGSFTQCVPAAPNDTYYLSYKFKAASSGSGTAHCYVAFLPSGNSCSIGDATSTFDVDVNFTNTNWVSGFSAGGSDSNTTHALIGCSMVFAGGYFDQLALSTDVPSPPGF